MIKNILDTLKQLEKNTQGIVTYESASMDAPFLTETVYNFTIRNPENPIFETNIVIAYLNSLSNSLKSSSIINKETGEIVHLNEEDTLELAKKLQKRFIPELQDEEIRKHGAFAAMMK